MNYNVEEILNRVLSEVFGVTWDEMMSIRKSKYFQAKWASIFLYIEAGQHTLNDGAEKFGLLGHSGAHHALRRCKSIYARNKAFRDKFNDASNYFPPEVRDYVIGRMTISIKKSKPFAGNSQTSVVRAYTKVPKGEEPVAYLKSVKFDIENGCFEGRRRKGFTPELKQVIIETIDLEIQKHERGR